jgi:hypothetical protein
MEIIRLTFNQGRRVQAAHVLGEHRDHPLQVLKFSFNFQKRLVGYGQAQLFK